jgi:hypothetical protein
MLATGHYVVLCYVGGPKKKQGFVFGQIAWPAMGASDSDAFYGSVPVFHSFHRLMEPALYTPLPDDWMLGLADVVGSTQAIAQNRYKAVNMAVCAENSNSDIMVMQSAEDCVGMDAPSSLNRARERRVLIQRAMRSRYIIVGGIGA